MGFFWALLPKYEREIALPSEGILLWEYFRSILGEFTGKAWRLVFV